MAKEAIEQLFVEEMLHLNGLAIAAQTLPLLHCTSYCFKECTFESIEVFQLLLDFSVALCSLIARPSPFSVA